MHPLGFPVGMTVLIICVSRIVDADATCYYPGGSRAPDNFPCNPDVSDSVCCPRGWTCYTNFLCVMTDGDTNTTYGIGATRRGTCTKSDWDPTACGAFCFDEGATDGTLEACGHEKFCCETDVAKGTCECDTLRGTFFIAAGNAQTVIGVTGTVPTYTPDMSTMPSTVIGQSTYTTSTSVNEQSPSPTSAVVATTIIQTTITTSVQQINTQLVSTVQSDNTLRGGGTSLVHFTTQVVTTAVNTLITTADKGITTTPSVISVVPSSALSAEFTSTSSSSKDGSTTLKTAATSLTTPTLGTSVTDSNETFVASSNSVFTTSSSSETITQPSSTSESPDVTVSPTPTGFAGDLTPQKLSITQSTAFKAAIGTVFGVLGVLLLALLVWWLLILRKGGRDEPDSLHYANALLATPEDHYYNIPEIPYNAYPTASVRPVFSSSAPSMAHTRQPFSAAHVGYMHRRAHYPRRLYEQLPPHAEEEEEEEEEQYQDYPEAPSPTREPRLPDLRIINATPSPPPTAPPRYVGAGEHTDPGRNRIPRRPVPLHGSDGSSRPLSRIDCSDVTGPIDPFQSTTFGVHSSGTSRVGYSPYE